MRGKYWGEGRDQVPLGDELKVTMKYFYFYCEKRLSQI